MYQSYWKLRQGAFESGLDHRFLYLSAQHEEALSRLKYVVEGRKPIGLLTGDYGVGKTQLARELSRRLHGQAAQLAYVSSPHLTMDEVLECVVRSLAASSPEIPSGRANLLRAVEEILLRNRQIGRLTAIVLDDSHLVKDLQVFEEFRVLLNLSFSSDAPLLSIILVGQTELRERIATLPQFRQRVNFPFHLGPLTAEDVPRYLEHRLKTAGSPAPGSVFAPDAVAAIVEISKGNPRVINALAEAALIAGAMRGASVVDASLIAEARSEVWA